MKRRTFVLSALGASGALVVGWAVTPPAGRLGSRSLLPPVALNGWVSISADGQVGVAVPRSEMGQGISTALPMLVAEELDVPLSQVHIVPTGDESIYGNVGVFVPPPSDDAAALKPRMTEWFMSKVARDLGIQITGGSSSVRDAWIPMRQAGAAARMLLIEAASRRWGVPRSTCATRDGQVMDGTGRALGYGELAQEAARLAPPTQIELKPPERFRLIGRRVSRRDSLGKVSGAPLYGIDVRLPGMLHATIRGCPQLGGTLRSFDAAQAERMPGVMRVVRYHGGGGCAPGVAVVARSHWEAAQALEAVRIEWGAAAGEAPEGEALLQAMRQALDAPGGWVFASKGDAIGALRTSHRLVQAQYEAPWLAHATMEPMNCTAQLVDGRLKLWAPTQAASFARRVAARFSGVDRDRIDLTVTHLGGGFGRRLESDFLVPAVQLAVLLTPAPVQVLWSREEDFAHDFYRPAAVARFQAGIDAGGRVFAWVSRTASDAISPQFLRRALPFLNLDTPDSTTAEGHFDQAYEFDQRHSSHVKVASPVPIGNWRSVGHSHNAFFTESFIDELAHATASDPVQFRLSLLQHHARHRAVLQLAAQKADWGGPMPDGRARGVALHESFGSIVAEVVEVSMRDGRPLVHRVVCAIDCGTAVNPLIIEQQMEGSVCFGLSAALRERITIRGGAVEQRNFPQYPLLRFDEAPSVETYVVPSGRPPAGVGEPGTPPIAPAVANALFTLTGVRQRSLPLIAA
ncbi:MAG TPA: molybdopterin cofactor-binding domain-containing protein [Burkholderiaceae bacterium]|nr:molybdopterin cofactor-binding domain-containing protein [Burkholderiaceae bacterium]